MNPLLQKVPNKYTVFLSNMWLSSQLFQKNYVVKGLGTNGHMVLGHIEKCIATLLVLFFSLGLMAVGILKN